MLSDSALSGGQVCSLSTALFNNAALDVHRRRDLDIECILNPEYDQAHMDSPLLRCPFLGLSLPPVSPSGYYWATLPSALLDQNVTPWSRVLLSVGRLVS